MAEAVGERMGKGTWLLLLVAFGAASGALLRYPLLTAGSGIAFVALFAIGLAVLGLPLLLAEAALGQFRRRNVVDAFGPGPWRVAGFAMALGAGLTAVVLAVVAAWLVGFLLGSFDGGFFDDPERHFRLVSAGWDTMLAALAVLVLAAAAAMSATAGKRGALAATGAAVLIAVALLTAWAFVQSGSSAGREQAVAVDFDAFDAPLVTQALLQALLPTAVGLGLVATLSGRVHDRQLPRDASLLAILLTGTALLGGLFLFMLAAANGHSLEADRGLGVMFFEVPRLFAQIGGTEGGMLFGLCFGALVAAAVVAIAALLEVPALWLQENWPTWTPRRAVAACALATYIVAVPLAFSPTAVHNLHLALAGIVAPAGGLALAVHVGWVRPQVLDGFRVGDVGHQLDAFLRPYLRFLVAPLLVLLLILGTMVFLADVGAIEPGANGLWRIVP